MFHNSFMSQVEMVDKILNDREWGWADLARKMGLSEQRVNNWRKRGIPAGKLRAVEEALGLKRFALEGDAEEPDDFYRMAKQRGLIGPVADFEWTYNHVTEEGKKFLMSAISAAKSAYIVRVKEERKTA